MDEEVRRLTKIWYKELKKSGFVDIEKMGFDGEPLDLMLGNGWLRSKEKMEDVESYYSTAREFLHICKFPNERARAIWSMHSEGLHSSEIGKHFNVKRHKVSKIIVVYKTKMKEWLNGKGEDFIEAGNFEPERDGRKAEEATREDTRTDIGRSSEDGRQGVGARRVNGSRGQIFGLLC